MLEGEPIAGEGDFDIHVVITLRRGIDGVLEKFPNPSASGRGVVIARRSDVLQDVARLG